MRRFGPVAAAVWVLVVAAITLANVARNRAGEPQSDVVLTERELSLPLFTPEEDTGLSLRLECAGRGVQSGDQSSWLDRAKLESLGFDCDYPVEAPSAPEHYTRMLPRSAVVVLEYDGDAARRWIAEKEKETSEALGRAARETDAAARERLEAEARERLERARISASRLFAVDAGLDLDELRRKYPDRSRYVLVQAIVRIHVEVRVGDKPPKPARLTGWLNPLVMEIHVPRDRRALLDRLVASDRKERQAARSESAAPGDALKLSSAGKPRPPRYRVHVRWGSRLEPWIVSVEPM